MLVNGTVNVINILAAIGMGLGVGPLPRLDIVDVGLTTALSRTVKATLVVLAIASDRTELSFTRPRDVTITRQLVAVSLPNFTEGMSSAVANFPLNGPVAHLQNGGRRRLSRGPVPLPAVHRSLVPVPQRRREHRRRVDPG